MDPIVRTPDVAAALRQRIVDGRFAPASELRQDEIARELGVSRTPLREALRLLEGEGLVESRAHRSMVVAPISADDLEQVYAMRIALESVAVRVTVPRLHTGELASMRGLLAEMGHHAGRRDIESWEGPHERFHHALTDGAGPTYSARCGMLRRASRRYRRAYLGGWASRGWSRGAAEHRTLCDACERGDADAAAARLAAHLATTALTLLANLDAAREAELLHAALAAIPGAAELIASEEDG